MKRIAFILAVMCLLVAGSGVASAAVNTIASSTMYFHGTLTVDGGVYTGTIDAVAGVYYIPGGAGTHDVGGVYYTPDNRLAIGGFDVYAKEGGNAYYDDVFQGVIGSDHDAYSNAGGWGDYWSPDVRDWENYQLTLTEDHWYLEYKGAALGTPMSGAMHWGAFNYASEDDTGSYRGTVPSDPDANDGGAALLGGGAGAWDMDWTWGSEVIPLEYSGFIVETIDFGGGTYGVSFTPGPVPEPATMIVWGLLGLVAAGYGVWRRRR